MRRAFLSTIKREIGSKLSTAEGMMSRNRDFAQLRAHFPNISPARVNKPDPSRDLPHCSRSPVVSPGHLLFAGLISSLLIFGCLRGNQQLLIDAIHVCDTMIGESTSDSSMAKSRTTPSRSESPAARGVVALRRVDDAVNIQFDDPAPLLPQCCQFTLKLQRVSRAE